MSKVCEFFVRGKTPPKGSTRSFVIKRGGRYTGRAVTTQVNAGELELWSEKVAVAAIRAGVQLLPAAAVSVTFYLKRPKSHFGARGRRPNAQARPLVKPDLDKLVRAVLDALTGVAWADDSHVVHILAWKEYADWVEEGMSVTIMEQY